MAKDDETSCSLCRNTEIVTPAQLTSGQTSRLKFQGWLIALALAIFFFYAINAIIRDQHALNEPPPPRERATYNWKERLQCDITWDETAIILTNREKRDYGPPDESSVEIGTMVLRGRSVLEGDRYRLRDVTLPAGASVRLAYTQFTNSKGFLPDLSEERLASCTVIVSGDGYRKRWEMRSTVVNR